VQGELEVVKEVHRKHIMEKREDGGELNGEAGSVVGTADGIVTETSKVPFLMLGLDLPPPPLFKDAMEKNIIPQVCLSQAHA
jgi:U4/U6.U5 tri-snRNP-associated protein 2